MRQGCQAHQPLFHALCLLLLCCLARNCAAQLEPPGVKLSDQLLKRYLSNAELAAWLQEYTHKCASIAKVVSIGKSVEGHDLWVLELSDKPGTEEAEPSFKYLANMHGDEPSGRVLLPQLAEWLCANYESDARATRVVNDMHLFIMPTMNPDGFARRRRTNGNNVDLNRNFPDPIEVPDPAMLVKPLPDAQPETLAIMQWLLKMRFTAAANLHEGAVCANYPFDGFTDHSMAVNGTRNPAPDDATFVHLAKAYAAAHATMAKSKEFKDGITNGAQWYPVYGGMQDWSYLAAGCMDITLELSDTKWRPPGDLPQLWQENRDALLALPLAAALGGVHGRVSSSGSGGSTPLEATISVGGIPRNSSSGGKFGYYNRPLAPGTYNITALAPGHEPLSAAVTVPADGSGVAQDFVLTPLPGYVPPPRAAGGLAMRPGSFLHAVRPHHVFGAAVLGVAVCAVGSAVVWTLFKGPSSPSSRLGQLLRRGGGGTGGGGGGFASRPLYQLVEMKGLPDNNV